MSGNKKLLSKVIDTLRALKFGELLKLFYSFIDIFVYLLLLIFKIVFRRRIVFCSITSSRIGHLAANTELFLRRLRSGKGYYNKRDIYIGYCQPLAIANKQLLKMYKREMMIIEGHHILFKPLYTRTWITMTEFHLDLPMNSNEYFEFSNLKPILSFTEEEEKEGKRLLKEMGISENDWFICFHARDSAYLDSQMGYQKWDYHDYRDSDINNYLKAAEYIVEQGGFSIRMGAKVEKPLPRERHSRIIDYATEYRSDFMDIYLCAKCKFFLGSAVGINSIPLIFNVPFIIVNLVPFEFGGFKKDDMNIPKLYKDTGSGRLIAFEKILTSGASRFLYTRQFEEAGIELIENSSEEILEVVKEMYYRLEEKKMLSKEEESLQKRFKTLFKQEHICYGSPAHIGTDFLRRYESLLTGKTTSEGFL